MSQPDEQPEEPRIGFFQVAAASVAASRIAAFQAAHYQRLVDYGIDPATAAQITAATSKAILENTLPLMKAINELAKVMPPAFESIRALLDNPIVRDAFGLDES